MSKTHPMADTCDYYASVDKYGLGAGVAKFAINAKGAKAIKTEQKGDIASVFNAIKPERYKVKSISEAVKNLAIMPA